MNDEMERTPRSTTHRALGFFTTRVVQSLTNGQQLVSHSRWHRKGLPPIRLDHDGVAIRAGLVTNPWIRFWAPHRLAWWIALLFIVGSACFALASFTSNWPQCLPAAFAHSRAVDTVFLIGSVFFTAAALLQWQEAVNGDVADIAAPVARQSWRWLAWRPRNAGFSASFIQLIGTLLFNANTADAMLSGMAWRRQEILIWLPNFFGSICFLASSYLAVIEVSHHFWSFQPRQVSWWIVVINLWGSIAFMLAALSAFFTPSTGAAVWAWGANFFTLVGAVCFLIAAYLMIPELFGAARTVDITSGPRDSQSTTEA